MSGKVHNAKAGSGAKVLLREQVLDAISQANVLDLYCGPVGSMHSSVWHRASGYTGVDKEWRKFDKRRRYVGDTMRILPHLDLQEFNVFDVDAFGCPWGTMVLLLRRNWAVGERGAVVVTDGASLKTRMGGLSQGMADLLGCSVRDHAPSVVAGEQMRKMCWRSWLKRAGVRVESHRHALGNGSGKGGSRMHYDALVFVGTGRGSEA